MELSVAENIFMGLIPTRNKLIDKKIIWTSKGYFKKI